MLVRLDLYVTDSMYRRVFDRGYLHFQLTKLDKCDQFHSFVSYISVNHLRKMRLYKPDQYIKIIELIVTTGVKV